MNDRILGNGYLWEQKESKSINQFSNTFCSLIFCFRMSVLASGIFVPNLSYRTPVSPLISGTYLRRNK